MYQIERVVDRQTLRDFITAPEALYQNDPNYITPLLWERQQALSPKNPYFSHAQWQGWVAYQNRQPVARISAQIDNLPNGNDISGYFGMFEAPDDSALAAELLETAESWLAEQGVIHSSGPFNLSINQEVGLLVDGFDTPPFFMMPHGLPYYEDLLLENGYNAVQDLVAMVMDPAHPNPPIMQRLLSRVADRITLRPVDRKRLTAELDVMCDIFNDAWAGNWGFVPFTLEEFRRLGRELFLVVPKQLVQIAEVDGEPAAFCVMLPNINEAIADLNGRLLPIGWAKLLWRIKVKFPKTSRAPLMGVRRKFQNTPMGPGLAFAVMDVVRKRTAELGVTQLEMSWILESNHAMRNMGLVMGAVENKRYRLYDKALG